MAKVSQGRVNSLEQTTNLPGSGLTFLDHHQQMMMDMPNYQFYQTAQTLNRGPWLAADVGYYKDNDVMHITTTRESEGKQPRYDLSANKSAMFVTNYNPEPK